jgi:hypothetical protein
MSLSQLATVVRDMKEDTSVRDAVAQGEAQVLDGFTTEEREALKGLAVRLRDGKPMPSHLKAPVAPMLAWA